MVKRPAERNIHRPLTAHQLHRLGTTGARAVQRSVASGARTGQSILASPLRAWNMILSLAVRPTRIYVVRDRLELLAASLTRPSWENPSKIGNQLRRERPVDTGVTSSCRASDLVTGSKTRGHCVWRAHAVSVGRVEVCVKHSLWRFEV
jgi:hypothetical protein